jgi:hypothetical protein
MADIIAHHCGLRINCFLFDRRGTLSYNGFVGEENHNRVVNVLLANGSSDPWTSPALVDTDFQGALIKIKMLMKGR